MNIKAALQGARVMCRAKTFRMLTAGAGVEDTALKSGKINMGHVVTSFIITREFTKSRKCLNVVFYLL